MAKTKTPTTREAAILSILINGERYGRQVRDEYEDRMQRKMPLGSLYVTLDRMEDAGFVTSRMGDASPRRGDNRRKYFKITGAGRRALNEFEIQATAIMGALGNVST